MMWMWKFWRERIIEIEIAKLCKLCTKLLVFYFNVMWRSSLCRVFVQRQDVCGSLGIKQRPATEINKKPKPQQICHETRRSKQCKSLIWIIILFSVLICYTICCAEQLSRGTLLRGTLLRRTLLWGILRDIDIWWYWVNIGRYWLVFGGTGSVWGSTGWYLVILGHLTWYC